MKSIMKWSARRAGPMLAGLLLTVCGGPALAQGIRIVIVNGEVLDETGLAIVDQLNCGDPVENGNYWIDFQNGLWGWVGRDGSYPFPDCSGQSQAPAQDSGVDDCAGRYPVYEDRMCYCYHVCM
jgi:hypothetical protein